MPEVYTYDAMDSRVTDSGTAGGVDERDVSCVICVREWISPRDVTRSKAITFINHKHNLDITTITTYRLFNTNNDY